LVPGECTKTNSARLMVTLRGSVRNSPTQASATMQHVAGAMRASGSHEEATPLSLRCGPSCRPMASGGTETTRYVLMPSGRTIEHATPNTEYIALAEFRLIRFGHRYTDWSIDALLRLLNEPRRIQDGKPLPNFMHTSYLRVAMLTRTLDTAHFNSDC
jgi:hypothetical protein